MGGVDFGGRGRLGRGGASGALRVRCRSCGGEGAGGLKMSVAWKMAVVHGTLMEDAALGSGASGRG